MEHVSGVHHILITRGQSLGVLLVIAITLNLCRFRMAKFYTFSHNGNRGITLDSRKLWMS
jgi:hypothetical protein